MAFHFQLCQPAGPVAALVQGLWSASVEATHPEPICRPLHSDGGSGMIFHLAGEVVLSGEVLPHGVVIQTVSKTALQIEMAPGAQLAGVRFHPAIGYGVLGRRCYNATLLAPADDTLYNLYGLYQQLLQLTDNAGRVAALQLWANQQLHTEGVIPDSLAQALSCIRQDEAPGQLQQHVALSQRQIERLFQLWLGMTPKYYQRIVRVRKALALIRTQQAVDLVDVALQCGFSDQAHMTREFRVIVGATPGRFCFSAG